MVSPLVVGREKSLMETLSLRRGSPVSSEPVFTVLLGVQEARSKSVAVSVAVNIATLNK